MRGRCVAFLMTAASIALLAAPVAAQQSNSITVADGDLGGVVTGPKGPEAGVWVIAETTDLATKFAKIVVTDDQGRYLIPDLPRPITASGCGATGSSIQRRSRARPASASI